MVQLILKLCNQVYKSKTFPKQWQISVIIPIHKPGKDPSLATNYRPIALTGCLCKLIEKIINVRLSNYLEKENKINKVQSGFRRNRSTTDNLVKIETSLRETISLNQHTIVVYFDLYKACDTTWKHSIVRKVHDYGMRGKLLCFIDNFMNNRLIKVRVNNSLSPPKIMLEGTPQGSVLSCTCFLVAINEITDNLPPSSKSTLYVDDFAIYASGRRPRQ